MKLRGKTILVTGASDGIGREISLRLAKERVKLILLSRNVEELNKVASEVKGLGAEKAMVIECDLRDPKAIEKAVKKIEKLDCLINNAGIWQKLNDLENISEEETIDIINTNLTGLILLTKHIIPLLKRAKDAAIINISSRSGYWAGAGQSVYSATKYGVRGFTGVLREDLKESSVRVAGVYQGGTRTNMFKKAGENWPKKRYDNFIPPEELAEVIVFMLSRPKHTWLPEVRVESK